MQLEVIPTWTLDSHDVLVLVMAAGVNYNGVWAALGQPISPLDGHDSPTTSQVRMQRASSGPSAPRSSDGRSATRSSSIAIRTMRRRGVQRRRPDVSSSQRIWGYETRMGPSACSAGSRTASSCGDRLT